MRGEAFGARAACSARRSSTGMTGYQETLTDPSYHRQVIVMTAPHIGNTGMNLEDPESGRIWAAGFVIRDLSPVASNWRATDSLGQANWPMRGGWSPWCRHAGTDQASARARRHAGGPVQRGCADRRGVDARIRSRPPGMLGANPSARSAPTSRNEVPAVGESRFTVVAVDLGIKRMTPTLMAQRGMTVHVVPPDYSYERDPRAQPDGDCSSPTDLATRPPPTTRWASPAVRWLMRFPTFGICFGNQILGRALGFDTCKLVYGTAASTSPCRTVRPGGRGHRTINHGFAVKAPLDRDRRRLRPVRVSHVCLNDDVVEGLQCLDVPAFSVQYHPEAAAGPHDSAYLFDRFAAAMEGRS